MFTAQSTVHSTFTLYLDYLYLFLKNYVVCTEQQYPHRNKKKIKIPSNYTVPSHDSSPVYGLSNVASFFLVNKK